MKTITLKKDKKLRITFGTLLILLFFVSCKNDSNYPSKEEAKAAVLEKINMAAEKYAKGDAMAYSEFAANDIVYIDGLGAVEPLVGIEALKQYLEPFKGQIPISESRITNPVFQVYDDIVIVNYGFQSIIDDVPVSNWRATSAYRYSNGNWESVLENWTEIKQ